MESKQKYLRDIRDALLHKEPSMAGVNGESEAKYLHDIAKAIREGGGSDGNDKVKQISIEDNKLYRVLLSTSNLDNTETDFIHKNPYFAYNPSTEELIIGDANQKTKVGKGTITSIKTAGDITKRVDVDTNTGSVEISETDNTDQSIKKTSVKKDSVTVSESVGAEYTRMKMTKNDILIQTDDDDTWDGEHDSLRDAVSGGGGTGEGFEMLSYYEYINDSEKIADDKLYLISPEFNHADDIMESYDGSAGAYDAGDLVPVSYWFNFNLGSMKNNNVDTPFAKGLNGQDSPFIMQGHYQTFQGHRYDWNEVGCYNDSQVTAYAADILEGFGGNSAAELYQIPTEWTWNGKTYYLKNYNYFYAYGQSGNYAGVRIYVTNNSFLRQLESAGWVLRPGEFADGFIFDYDRWIGRAPQGIYRPYKEGQWWNITNSYYWSIFLTNGQFLAEGYHKQRDGSYWSVEGDAVAKMPANYMLQAYLNYDGIDGDANYPKTSPNKYRYEPTIYRNGKPLYKIDQRIMYRPTEYADNVLFYPDDPSEQITLTTATEYNTGFKVIENAGIIEIGLDIDGTPYYVNVNGYAGNVNGDYGRIDWTRAGGTGTDELTITWTGSGTCKLVSLIVLHDIYQEGWVEEQKLVNGNWVKVYGLHPYETNQLNYAAFNSDHRNDPAELYFIPDES